MLTGFGIAALLHGFYDFLVLLNPVSALPIAATLIISVGIWRLILMRRLQDEAIHSSRRE